MDVASKHFKSLPTELKYELLTDVKERRKQHSWHKMSEMPRNADGFSGFQMERLVRRSQMQKTLNEVGKTLQEECAQDLDASLFVGDKEGLRKTRIERVSKV